MEKDFNIEEAEDFEVPPTFMLYDEETGGESEYTLLARTVLHDKLYYALSPASDSESYIVLEVSEDGDDIVFKTVEDDALFDELADTFDALFEEEFDFDN